MNRPDRYEGKMACATCKKVAAVRERAIEDIRVRSPKARAMAGPWCVDRSLIVEQTATATNYTSRPGPIIARAPLEP